MSTSRLGVVSFIRFQLGELRAKNGHHDFEHLCRHLARATICARLLPATGPVQGGGDQGRDFESFAGREDGLPAHADDSTLPERVTGFVGIEHKRRLVFTCTLQSSGLESKLKADITAILEHGGPVDAVHSFMESNLPVARRHALQDWARSRGVDLTIHDGEAIAESIATPDQFWIAVELLHVPSDLWPTRDDIQYSAQKERWLRASDAATTPDFQETRELARFCCHHPEFRPELPFWHTALRNVMARHPLADIQRRAAYELVMTAAHSREWDLTGLEDAVAKVMEPLDDLSDYGSLTDAMNVLAAAHLWAGGYTVSEEMVRMLGAWHERLVERIGKAMEWESATGVLALRELLVYATDRFVAPDARLAELIAILEASTAHPLFPLECAKVRIDAGMLALAESPLFVRLTTVLDEAVARRSGNAAAAQNRRARAHALHDAGDSLNAIRQLQSAKRGWYGSGQLDETVDCLFDLTDWYLELRLPLAAKYNAQTACGMLMMPAGRHDRGKLGEALRRVATCDFIQGAWLKAAELAPPAAGAQLSMSSSAQESRETVAAIAALLGVVLTGARLWNPELERKIRDVVFTHYGLPSHWDASSQWSIASWRDLLRDAELEDVHPPPFSDAKSQRTLEWLGLGVHWRLSYENNELEDRVGEQIGAALQLTMAEADARVLEVVCENVALSLQLSKDSEDVMLVPVENASDGVDRRYVLSWPARTSRDHEAFLANLLTATALSLSTVSMLPVVELENALKRQFEADWWHKVLFARKMPDLDSELNPRLIWSCKTDGIGPDAKSIAPDRRMQSWPRGLSDRYKATEVEGMLRRRYEVGLLSTRLTLPRLLQLDDFRSTVEGLRSEGYLDWQILMAVSVLAANKRYEAIYGDDADDDLERMTEVINSWVTSAEEDALPAVAVHEFSEQNIRVMIENNMMATIAMHGLVPLPGKPNFPAVKAYLAERFRYFDDDVEHDDPFCVPVDADVPGRTQ
jgi:hypothetical protein